MRKVLVTGAAGRVGRLLLPTFVEAGYRLRLFDRVRPEGPEVDQVAESEIHVADITDEAAVGRAAEGIDTIVHLAANPAAPSYWSALREPNVEGLERVLTAAVRAGVRRVVLASSVHAAGAYVVEGLNRLDGRLDLLGTPDAPAGVDLPVDPAKPPAPCCPYGSTKALGEALGRAYAYREGLSVLNLRFGAVGGTPTTEGSARIWIAEEDVRQLVSAAVEASDTLTYGVYNGLSIRGGLEWDLTNAERDLGYRPTAQPPDDLEPGVARWLCGPPPYGSPAPLVPEA